MTVAGLSHELDRELVSRRLRRIVPDAVRKHGVEVDGKVYPIKQAFAAVTGLQPLDFGTHTARAAFKKLGYRVVPE
jgi:hypothetical protein